MAPQPHTSPTERGTVRRVLAATTVGNLVEWFDYLVYAYVASTLATIFFPAGDHGAALLATFAIYGVSFLVRPLASPFWGSLGDRVGRRKVLTAVILLMGASTFAVGVLPTYAQVGLLAPLLLLLCRIVQGFAATGEWVGSLSFLLESSPARRRGFLLGINSAATILPGAIAALFLLVLRLSMSKDAFESYGWRIPFLVGGVLALVGFYIRNKLDETPAFREVERTESVEKAPVRSVFRNYPRQLVSVFSVAALMSLSVYSLLTYMPTFLAETAKLTPTNALVTSSAATVVLTLLIPLFAGISDRVGRRPLLIAGSAALVVLSIPGYLLVSTGTTAGALGGLAILIVGPALIVGTGGAVMVEIFPTKVRYTGSALSQTLAYTLFGGTAAFVSQALVSGTGQSIAPAFYITAVALVVLLMVVFVVPETSRLSLDGKPDDVPAPAPNAA